MRHYNNMPLFSIFIIFTFIYLILSAPIVVMMVSCSGGTEHYAKYIHVFNKYLRYLEKNLSLTVAIRIGET